MSSEPLGHRPTDPAPPPPCPLRPGLHGWIWPGGKGEGWKTAREQASRAVDLGFAGVIAQSGLSAPAWLDGKDPGETLTRRTIFQSVGLQVTAGLGLDSRLATAEAIALAISTALQEPDECVMADWESEVKWESQAGRDLATRIDDLVINAHPDATARCCDCPWWEPQYHGRAPTVIFQRLFPNRFVQAYGAPAAGNPVESTEWMLAQARAHYPPLGIPASCVRPAEQMYGHTLINSCRLLLDGEPVIALWDVEEMDATFRSALHARKFLLGHGLPATRDGVRTFQASHGGLTVDGDVGPLTLAAMGIA